jgi:hypothetical protein
MIVLYVLQEKDRSVYKTSAYSASGLMTQTPQVFESLGDAEDFRDNLLHGRAKHLTIVELQEVS